MHQALLQQRAVDVRFIRPRVISSETRERLDEYRGFRHIVRNVYTYHLSQARMARLVDDLRDTFQRVRTDMEQFVAFLETSASADKRDSSAQVSPQ